MGSFFIKGYIHITELETKIKPDGEEVISKLEYEVVEDTEDFFHAGFYSNGESVSQSDIDITLKYDLRENNLNDFKLELDKYYSVLWNFKLVYHKDYWGEVDCDIDTIQLEIKEVPEGDFLTFLKNGFEEEMIAMVSIAK